MGPVLRSARRAAGLIAVAVTLITASTASAATFTVGTMSDTAAGTRCPTFPSGCSLRQLIEHENGLASTPSPPDTIIVPTGGYSVNSALTITQGLSIQGAGARTTSVGESTSDRVFVVNVPTGPSPGPVPNVTISGLTIEFGAATANNGSFGGNVLNRGTLTLSGDWLVSGTAQSGAGVSNDGGALTVTHSLISGNNSNSGGADSGGIQNFGPNPVTGTAGTLEVDNSTISNNTSSLGGGIFSWCGGNNGACSSSSATNTTTIVNSTIAHNDGGTRSTNGGGLLISGGTMSVQNSIVASNTVTDPLTGAQNPSNCAGAGITSLGHNLETGTECGFKSPGDLQGTDPQFASTGPQDNGGSTNTFAPALTSPVVDAIPGGAPDCGGTDQRDVARPQGNGCDIGAFEVLQPTEGSQFTSALASASCSIDTLQPITVTWGDGTSSAGTTDGQDALIGTHTYAEEGTYTYTVQWTDDCGSHNPSFQLHVPDASLSGVGTSVTAQAGTPLAGSVAKFVDGDPGGTASDYTASINWGDGVVSSGTVSSASGGFQIAGNHTYAAAGSYATTVSIADAGGAGTVVHGSAIVDGAPSPVITGKPPSVGGTTAAFTGSINPSGLPTAAFFQYGLDPKYTGGGPVVYNQSTPAQTVGSDFTTHIVTASVTGLVPNATYHVRLVATNSAGTTLGTDVVFNTLRTAPPGAPALGKTFNVSVVSGVVLIEINGVFIPITELRQIPANTVINALHGTLNLTTALPAVQARDAAAKGKKKKAKTQSGTFGGAIFKITQATKGAGKGLATLAIVEGAFKGAPSYATCKKAKAGDATAAALSSKTLQLLHASAKGKFATKGKYSAATVRGTKWTVADRCDGTLTHDITHSVAVSDFVRHKTIILHAGQSYLAKAPKHK